MRRLARTCASAVCVAVGLSIATAAPANASSIADGVTHREAKNTLIGRLNIPRLNLRSPIYSGITMNVFAKGMGYWPGSAMPGQHGNVVLAGHRTSSPRPLFNIQKLAIGDSITINHKGMNHTYVVTKTQVVAPSAIWITNPTNDATLTMFACHPRGSTKYRYVVFAKLMQ